MKRIFPIFCSLLIVLSMVCIASPSASAREYLDYNDYITDITVDGDNDLITVEFPVDQAQWGVWIDGEPYTFPVGDKLSMEIYGIAKVGCWVNNNFIDLTNIPADTVFTITYYMDFEVQGVLFEEDDVIVNSWLYYENGQTFTFPIDYGMAGSRFTYTPDRTYGDALLIGFITSWMYPDLGYVDFYCQLEGFTMQMSISSLYRLQEATGKTNEILSAVEQQLEAQGKTLEDILDTQEQTNEKLDGIQGSIDDTNDKLDDLITGGDAADDLIAGGDKLEDAGEGLGENIGQVQEFEDQYMAQLDDQLPAILESADITFLFVPLSFVQRYADMVVDGIPSGFLVVFTLPALLGLLFYMLGHPIRAPRPDTSGDTVTRETFTTTTVLEGRHAGSTTTTRTVTTSHEIGRTHASDN